MRAQLGSDLVLIASGSIRTESLGPIVTMEDLMLAFPYESAMIGLKLTGAKLRKIMKYLLRDDMLDEDVWTEWFQFSNGFFCEYNKDDHEILKLTIDGKDVVDEELYSVAVQSFFYCSMKEFFGISAEEAEESSRATELASSMFNVLVEYFENHDYIKHDGEKRLLIH